MDDTRLPAGSTVRALPQQIIQWEGIASAAGPTAEGVTVQSCPAGAPLCTYIVHTPCSDVAPRAPPVGGSGDFEGFGPREPIERLGLLVTKAD